MKLCSACNTEVRLDDAQFCPACGTRLAPLAAFAAGDQVTLINAVLPATSAAPAAATVLSATSAVLSTASPTPRVSDRYEIRRFLGEGGAKRVYLAWDRRLEREVAIGILKTDRLGADGRSRLDREARAMARLGDHPNVVTIYDIEETADLVYLVCRFMDRGSLADRLAREPLRRLDLPVALRYAAQIARALAHAHAAGVVHRDVKPGNVWLGADDTALLGDFGLALASDRTRLTTEGSLLGTASYIAPEQAMGQHPGPAADLYSLGCMLYETVTGRRPFEGDDPLAVISQHLHAEAQPPSYYREGLPAALDELTKRLLAKQPEERPAGAAEVAFALESMLMPVAADGGVAPTAVTGGRRGQFVGRREELARLKAVFDSILQGRGQLCMLVGEPGIGKTRTTQELAVYASLRGARVLTGPCYEGDTAVPYLPFAEALRQYCRERSDDDLRCTLADDGPQVGRLVAEIHRRYPDIEAPPKLEGDAERQRLFDGIASFLGAAAEREPLVIVLEDLHWADQPSLLLLRHLARRLSSSRVLLLGTYRDVDLDRTHPLSDTLAALKREQPYERILLRGFPRDDVRALLQAIGDQEPPAEFVDEIHAETEGNPFFVQEVLRHLVDVGAIRREEGRWVGDVTVVRQNLPEGIKEVVGRRLSRLSESCNQMLARASLLTRSFTFELLRESGDEDEDALLDLLDEALTAHILREDRKGRYDFEHALVRQTLASELSTPRRIRLHRRLGEALARLHAADPEPVLAELAHQFWEAAPSGVAAEAVRWCAAAGVRAMRMVAWEEAVLQYRRALELAAPSTEEEQRQACEWELQLGDALFRSQDNAGAIEAYRAASMRAAKHGFADLAEKTATSWGLRLWVGGIRPDFQLELNDRALATLGGAGGPMRARLLAMRAQALSLTPGAEAERVAAIEEATVLVRDDRDPATLFPVLHGRFNCGLTGLEPPTIERAVDQARRSDQPTLLMQGLSVLGNECLSGGDRAGADRAAAEFMTCAERLQDPTWLHVALLNKVRGLLLDGNWDGASALFPEIARVMPPGDEQSLAIGGFEIARHKGQLEPFVDVFGALAQSTETGYHFVLPYMHAEIGDLENARVAFDRAASAGFADLPRNSARGAYLCANGETCFDLEDRERAPLLLPLCEEFAGQAVIAASQLCLGAMDLIIAILLSVIGRPDEADRAFAAALALNERLRTPPWVARTHLRWAQALERRGNARDDREALAHIAAMRPIAERLGQSYLLAKAAAVESRIAARAR